MLKLHVEASCNILLFFATVLNLCGMFFQRLHKTVTLMWVYKSYTNIDYLIIAKYIKMPWEHTKDRLDASSSCRLYIFLFLGCFPC